jgi:ABC-type glycerol-3-phosphate transport system substrate-binding protein
MHTGMRESFDAAIAGYQQLHPDVIVRQLPVPTRAYPAWARTQLSGGTAPDIIGMHTLKEEDLSTYLQPLSPFLYRPNPYNVGTSLEEVPWRDTFIDGLTGIRNLTPTTGEISGVNLQFNTYRLYYNRLLLAEITGSDKPPGDFASLAAFGRQVADFNARTGRKLIPIAVCGPYAQPLFTSLQASQTQRLTMQLSPNNLRVIPLQLAGLILEGKVNYDTPAIRSSLQLMCDFAALLTPGFLQQQRDEPLFAYVHQQAVMLYAGSWDYAGLVSLGNFPTGMMPLPLPSQDDPNYGAHVLGPVSEAAGNIDATLGITRSSRNPGIALDFLQYLTSQPVANQFTRLSNKTSAIVGTKPPPDAAALAPQLNGELSGFSLDFIWFGASSSYNFFQRHFHAMLGSTRNIDAFVQRLNAEMPGYLRQDVAWQLNRTRRDVQRLDALVGLYYTMPIDDPARQAWTRLVETQHTRQLEYLQLQRHIDP